MNAVFHFLEHFEASAKAHPNKVAIVDGEERITFAELWKKANLLSKKIKKYTSKETLIAIDAEEGISSYESILAIWLAGKSYVPITSNWPEKRLEEILKEGGIKTLLSSGERYAPFFEQIIDLKNETAVSEQNNPSATSDTAYVLFTSGSTGKPKGVVISKDNLNAFHRHYLHKRNYSFSSEDRFLQSYELSFDVSVFCFTLPLMLGATLYLLPQKGVKFIQILGALKRFEITVTSNVPSLLRFSYKKLADGLFPCLRYSFFSGEALQGQWAKLWIKACPNALVYNCYGPTETTIVCTTELLNRLAPEYFEAAAPLPLGKPFDGTEIKLIENEICFSGEQVFDKYLNVNKPELQVYGKTWYPSGDLAFYDVNGKLIFTGRRDQQVQVDGYRVELEEIAGAIRKSTSYECSVFYLQLGEQFALVAAIEAENMPSEKEIVTAISDFLPAYALPKFYVSVSAFPINHNGKVDLKKLREMVLISLR